MMKHQGLRLASLLLGAALFLSACAQPAEQSRPGNQPSAAAPAGAPAAAQSASGQARPARTLVAAVRVEPLTLATRPVRAQGVAVYLTGRIGNAEIALRDAEGNPQPYLAESLPTLNSNDWRVFPDGRMETRYRLKPNLTWHDGTPLSAEDFVFSWRAYTNPDLGAGGAPFTAIDEVTAPDDRTLLVKWRELYPDAASFSDRNAEFPPLPRHVLEESFSQGSMDSFANHPYWTSEYIGLGPFKLDHWEPGTAIEVSAFDGHVLGKPKIARMRIVFIADGNTTLANMIAGEVHLSADTSLRVGNVPTLRQEWGPGGGSVVLHPNQWRATNFQMRPELASPPAILDPRARKALAHTIDKEPINEAVYHGNSVVAHTIVPASSEMGKAVDAAITKYAYDLRQAERLMGEAGFTKGSDGTYTSPSGGRFSGELKTNGAADNEAEISILASGWKQAGFDIAEAVNPTSLARDGKVRATFPSMFSNNTTVGLPSVLNMVSARIPREETRWQGGNRGGWSNPTYDRLVDAFGSELDRNERTRLLVDAMKVLNDDLPAISLFYRTQPWAHVAALTGPKLAAPDANVSWDIYAWEFR